MLLHRTITGQDGDTPPGLSLLLPDILRVAFCVRLYFLKQNILMSFLAGFFFTCMNKGTFCTGGPKYFFKNTRVHVEEASDLKLLSSADLHIIKTASFSHGQKTTCMTENSLLCIFCACATLIHFYILIYQFVVCCIVVKGVKLCVLVCTLTPCVVVVLNFSIFELS